MRNSLIQNLGFTLIETLIAIAIFAVITTGIYFSFSNIIDIFSASYLNLTALSALDNEFETVRNMSYTNVGVQGGSPAGSLLAEKNLNYGGVQFVVKTVVRNIDDPFDGTQGGTPNDLAPADYKLVEIEITCPTCPRFINAKSTTTVAPSGLETVTNNGTLIIKAIDASGQPVVGANVVVVNNSVSPVININDVTDSTGALKLVDTPNSPAGYAITVSKNGYSTDKNYKPGDPANPNPIKPYATVVQQQVTQTSFVIDRVSTINVKTQDKFCVGVGSIDFLQVGQKIIGTNPNVLKYSTVHITDANGDKAVNNLEFDTYDFKNQDTAYEVNGFTPLTPIAINPNSTYGLTWLMEAKNPSAILVTVKNQSNQLIDDATVTLTKTGFSDVKYSGRRFFSQTDWSGNQYTSKTNYIMTDNPVGQLVLGQIGGKYSTASQELISSTYDLGTTDNVFYDLSWNPTSQPPQAGSDSLKIQLASNNDNSTWNFVGPDGTTNTYYTTSGTQIHSSHNGNRYLRYKIILFTQNNTYTPQLTDVTLNFNSSCIPDGQAYFSGLSQANYKIKIEKSGYQTFNDNNVQLNSTWKDYRATLSQ